GGSEEAEGIDVGAHQLLAFDDRVGLRRGQAQREILVTLLIGPEAVHHCPLVQSQAAELRAPAGQLRGGQQAVDEGQRITTLGQEAADIGSAQRLPVAGRATLPGAAPWSSASAAAS